MLACQGVKKTQADKALAALAEAGKIVVKEFGKTKIYYPLQQGLVQLAPEVRGVGAPHFLPPWRGEIFTPSRTPFVPSQEKAAKMAEIKELGAQVKAQDEAVAALKRGEPRRASRPSSRPAHGPHAPPLPPKLLQLQSCRLPTRRYPCSSSARA
jgi:hypothetical protein